MHSLIGNSQIGGARFTVSPTTTLTNAGQIAALYKEELNYTLNALATSRALENY